LYFPVAAGSGLAKACRGAVVAFEIDDADVAARTGCSVLVVGRAREVVDGVAADSLPDLPFRWSPTYRDTVIQVELTKVSGRAIAHAVEPNWPHLTDHWLLTHCPGCGSDALLGVTDGDLVNLVCTTCISCWHVELGAVSRVSPSTCPGCKLVDLCRAAHAGVTIAVPAQRS
jgi:hypothetical protein